MSEKTDKARNPLEHMECPDSEWLNIWEEYWDFREYLICNATIYVDLKKKNAKEAMETMRTIQKAFERLKNIAPEMYEAYMTKETVHWMFFLISAYTFGTMHQEMRTETMQWLKSLWTGKTDNMDFWNVLRSNYGKWEDEEMKVCTRMCVFVNEDAERILQFMEAWIACYRIPVKVDMSDAFQAKIIFRLINLTDEMHKLYEIPMPLKHMESLLTLVERFDREPPAIFVQPLTEALLYAEDTESLRVAMKKKLVTEQMAQMAVAKIIETGRFYDQMPLWILRIYSQI